ncbi:MAG: hypothetical protein MZV70_34555 [Desulfobacterales bacterium]|nr:hypothetical protein [Desulfobacterales bacterium]
MRFREGMDDDFNTARCSWATSWSRSGQVNAYLTGGHLAAGPPALIRPQRGRADAPRGGAGVLGDPDGGPRVSTSRRTGCGKRKSGARRSARSRLLIDERLRARAEKDWKRADDIRGWAGGEGDCFERFEGRRRRGRLRGERQTSV